jgi:hypothetical protein
VEDALLKFIRSRVPNPVLFACVGFPIFGLMDLITGHLVGHFVNDKGRAALASAIIGAVSGWWIGRYANRKNGLSWKGTPYDVDDAHAAKKRSAGSKPMA